MDLTTPTAADSKVMRWTGYVLSGLAILFVFADGGAKVLELQPVIEASRQLGFPPDVTRELGVTLLVSGVLYAFSRTAVLGAILLTGFLGGAVATHVRLGHPLFSHVLFGVYVGLFVWGGLFLRDPELRSLIPFRRGQAARALD